MQAFLASLRVAVATMAVCVVGYSAAVLGFAQAVTPETARGSLIIDQQGTVIGSRSVAQAFTQSGYFWPRPSAVDYDGAGAGGSNKSPTSTDLADRASEIVVAYGATPDNPLPPELAAASGGGLDPHITESGALYQRVRVAEARGIEPAALETLIAEHAFSPGGIFAQDRLINVLELNLALDQLAPTP